MRDPAIWKRFVADHGLSIHQADAAIAVLIHHFELADYKAELMTEKLVGRSFGNPPPYVRRQEDKRRILNFWQALQTVANTSERLSPGASEHLITCFVGYYIEKDRSDLPELKEKLKALTWIEELRDLMKPVITLIEGQIESAPA